MHALPQWARKRETNEAPTKPSANRASFVPRHRRSSSELATALTTTKRGWTDVSRPHPRRISRIYTRSTHIPHLRLFPPAFRLVPPVFVKDNVLPSPCLRRCSGDRPLSLFPLPSFSRALPREAKKIRRYTEQTRDEPDLCRRPAQADCPRGLRRLMRADGARIMSKLVKAYVNGRWGTGMAAGSFPPGPAERAATLPVRTPVARRGIRGWTTPRCISS